MAKPKSFIKNLVIDEAKKSHNCQHSKQHRINQGDIRLGLKDSRSTEYYCKECAIEFLKNGASQVSELIFQIENFNESK